MPGAPSLNLSLSGLSPPVVCANGANGARHVPALAHWNRDWRAQRRPGFLGTLGVPSLARSWPVRLPLLTFELMSLVSPPAKRPSARQRATGGHIAAESRQREVTHGSLLIERGPREDSICGRLDELGVALDRPHRDRNIGAPLSSFGPSAAEGASATFTAPQQEPRHPCQPSSVST